eukprot:CAMPEP_0194546380 /NCGR_PEP_ID=MMETSP0253-20130528/90575_1 /TAXON_ID=2966 /ORGANISM="Noctiluca scintillans" /LENGTH=557 /DNA_ID=CAMNT_0039393463 /DNA_START=162 /DNA_END=1832 /DNA_ORIENTATION=+
MCRGHIRPRQRFMAPRVTAFCEWIVPPEYNWHRTTQQNYEAAWSPALGDFAAARALIDTRYHGSYTEERSRFQDALLRRLLGTPARSQKSPVLLFTAGAMGVGKTAVVRWMHEQKVLNCEDFVLIDPDKIAQMLPEWHGYQKRDPDSASLSVRLEAGLLTELSLVTALQQRRNILVDSSLRHGAWYARVLERLRKEVPDITIVLLYVHAEQQTIYNRAEQRGESGGRKVHRSEVQDSLRKMSRAVGRLLPHVDFFAQVANDSEKPCISSVYSSVHSTKHDLDVVDVENSCAAQCGFRRSGWPEVREMLFKGKGGEPAETFPDPPPIFPPSSVRDIALLLLLRTAAFAVEKHQAQTRKDPMRACCVSHSLAVARILAEEGVADMATLQAAVLHDVFEDTATTRAELRGAFGDEVVSALAVAHVGRRRRSYSEARADTATDLAQREQFSRVCTAPPLPEETVEEHDLVLSLLRVSEFLARSLKDQAVLMHGLNVAIVLVEHGVRHQQILEAAFLVETVPRRGSASNQEIETALKRFPSCFSAETVSIVSALAQSTAWQV